MADPGTTGNNAVQKASSPIIKSAAIDDDLIDYDSDDADLMQPNTSRVIGNLNASAFDAKFPVTEATRATADAPESVKSSEGTAGLLPGTTSLGVRPPEQQSVGSPEGRDEEIFDDFALVDDGNTAEPVLISAVADQAPRTYHEIDYEESAWTDASNVPAYNTSDQSATQQPSVSSPGIQSGPEAPKPQVPKTALMSQASSGASMSEALKVTAAEPRVKRYEIDWEDDEDIVTYGAQGGVEKVGAETTAVDAHVGNTDEQDTEAALKSCPLEEEAVQLNEKLATTEPAQPEEFPPITVLYKGEEFAMFSHSSDGFFSDISILDQDMKIVLDGLRKELAAEIGPHDDLVLQVDKLGLEFSESSPSDALTALTLRQILDLLEILVKNKETDKSRTLLTYLITRPNTMKRYEFLVESATADKELSEVVYFFPPPLLHDGYEEQSVGYEGTGDDVKTHTSQGNTESYEDATLLEHDYNHDQDYQEEYDTGENLDPVDPVDPGIGGETAAAMDQEYPDDHQTGDEQGSVDPSVGDEVVAASEQVTEYPGFDTDVGADEDAESVEQVPGHVDNGRGDISQLFDNDLATVSDEDFLDAITGEDQISRQNAGGHGEKIFDHRLDPDLIDYSSAGDKVAGEGDGLPVTSVTAGNGDVEALDVGIANYETGNSAAHAEDEDLIDYESVGGDIEVDGNSAGPDSQKIAGDDEDAASAHADYTYDADLIDYSADGSVDFDAVQGEGADSDDDYSSGDKDAVAHEALARLKTSGGQFMASSHTALDRELGSAEGLGSLQMTGDAHGKPSLAQSVVTSHKLLHEGVANLPRDSLTMDEAQANSSSPAHDDGALERLLGIGEDDPDVAAYADWDNAQATASADYVDVDGDVMNSDKPATAGSSTSATLRENGDAMSTPEDVASRSDLPGQQAKAGVDGVQNNNPAPDAQFNVMKRARSGEVDEDDGSDVKRRRS